MKINIYELLGMIKDGKAPKKIRYKGKTYYYDEFERDYQNDTFTNVWIFENLVTDILNDEVEILEITLNTKDMNITSFEIKNNQIVGTWKNGIPYHYTLSAPQKVLAEKMLEIIEAINEKDMNISTLKEDKIEKIDVAWQNVFDEQAQQDFAKMTLNKINEIIEAINEKDK